MRVMKTDFNEIEAKWTTGKVDKVLFNSAIKNDARRQLTCVMEENITSFDNNGNILVEEDSTSASVAGYGFNGTAFATGASSTGVGAAGDIENSRLRSVSLALARRVIPSLFAHNCVGIQPMSLPVGQCFAIRSVYKGTNDESNWNKVAEYSGWSGGYSQSGSPLVNVASTFADIGNGAVAGQGTSGPVDQGRGANSQYAEGWAISTDWPELELKIDKKTITAEDRRASTTFSQTMLQDVPSMHNIDIKAIMIAKLQAEVVAELNREIITAMKLTAQDVSVGGATALTVPIPAGDKREATATVVNAILFASQVVGINVKTGSANVAVVSPGIAAILQTAAPVFTNIVANVNGGIVLSGAETTQIGTINGTIAVYVDQYAKEEYALLAYKGADATDGGIIWSPFLMNVVYDARDAKNFNDRVGVISRYALTTNLLSAGSYYRLLKFTGLQNVLGFAPAAGWGYSE